MKSSAQNISAQQGLSRREAAAGIAATLALTPQALAQTAHDSTPEEFSRLMKQLSNWNRWGKDDQMGAVNLITPAKRKQAALLVREGASFSMARNAETLPAVDNPQPIVRKTTRLGKDSPEVGIGGTGDNFFISYHGYVHTHMDTLCHFLYDGKMYNGYSRLEVSEEGAAKNSILNFKNGIITRGVLMDMARHKGVDYLEPGTPIYPEDLDAWEKKAGVKVQRGDVMIVRTGRWARRDAKGPWSIQQDGLAGLHMSCAKWMYARDVAIIGGEGEGVFSLSGGGGFSPPLFLPRLVGVGILFYDNSDLELVGGGNEGGGGWVFRGGGGRGGGRGATGAGPNPYRHFRRGCFSRRLDP